MPDASALGDSQGLLALAGTLGLGVWSAVNLRKGQRDTHDLDADKQELDRERFEAEQHAAASAEKDRIIEMLRAEVARLTAAREADEERHDRDTERAEARHVADRAQREADLARERAARDADREAYLRELGTAREAYATVVAMLRGEVEETAAGEGVTTHRAHLTSDTDHP